MLRQGHICTCILTDLWYDMKKSMLLQSTGIDISADPCQCIRNECEFLHQMSAEIARELLTSEYGDAEFINVIHSGWMNNHLFFMEHEDENRCMC